MSDYFPPEILREILKRLPVESLVRCTCVSKQWLSLINNPNFISLHRSFSVSHPPSSRRIILSRYVESSRTQRFSLHIDDSSSPDSFSTSQNAFPSPFKARDRLFFRIVGCIQGILCLSDDIFGMTGVIILWNPLIKRFILLPQPRVVFDEVGPYMFALGFGFDSKTDDYKVVRVAYVQGRKQPDELPPLVEIYSLKTGSWKEIKAAGVQYCMCEMLWTQCFINGHIHWIAYETKSRVIYSLILLFDVSEERFKKMKLPESLVKVSPMVLKIKELGGSLTVLHYDEGKNCDVWMRKEYGSANSWTKMYSVILDCSVKILRANGEFLVSTKSMFASYDPNSQKTTNLGIEGTPVEASFHAFHYDESLVLLDKASYGGANPKGTKKKKNQRSIDTSQQKEEEDQSLILVSEADSSEMRSTGSVRQSMDRMAAIYVAYQLAKFERLTSSDEGYW